jgi:proline-specific peptidase
MAHPAARMRTGSIPFSHAGETFYTFYKVFGDLKNYSKAPLIILHGGPGLVHDHLTPFSDLSVNASIPVILYDQLGNGLSSHIKDKPEEFWSIDLFVDELSNLIKVLNIQDSFDLAGHSWGGIVASEFIVRRQPKGVKHLILTNSLPAFSLWMQSNDQLMQTFPKDVQEGLMAGLTDPKRYLAAILSFYKVHGCTLNPQPPAYMYALEMVFGEKGDPTVAATMYVAFAWFRCRRQLDEPDYLI